MPIHFMHKSLPFDELCALYTVSDVCLVSSTRDGMNLVSECVIHANTSCLLTSTPRTVRYQVSYEYIACQQARQGVLILSEFAGAAQSLNGSIVVNPWDSQQVADAIHEAVTMDPEQRAENHRKLFKYVNKYSAAFWGSSFIREMSRIKVDADATSPGSLVTAPAVDASASSQKEDKAPEERIGTKSNKSSITPPSDPITVPVVPSNGTRTSDDASGQGVPSTDLANAMNGQAPTPQAVSPAA